MKTRHYTFALLLLCTLVSVHLRAQPQSSDLQGAWEAGPENNRIVMICAGNFFAAAVYDMTNKKFLGTCGGTWKLDGNTFVEVHEFNTMMPERVGQETRTPIELKNGMLIFKESTESLEWKRIDDGAPGQLAGAWLITGRKVNDEMHTIKPGARRTMKILSGTRFQWIAYNAETKEFFGTGGGTYTTQNGKYTEHIDFFSRDNSRVGASLEFDFSLEDGNWRHKGLSSKGDPIDEVWTKREKTGI